MSSLNQPVTTREQFHQRLNALIASAVDNGVDISGGYPYLTPLTSYDVEIIELAQNPRD